MNRDFLKELGLTDEQADKVVAKHGEAIQSVNSKLANAESQVESLNSQVKDRDTQIATLSDQAGNSDEMKKQIEDLQSTIKTNDEQAAQNLLQVKQDNAIQNYLKDAGARDVKAILPFVDSDTIKYDDDKGELTGLSEQVEKIKGDHDYLFQEEEKPNEPGINITPKGNPDGAPTAKPDAFAQALGLHTPSK